LRNYFVEFGRKLNIGRSFVVQCLDESDVDYRSTDALRGRYRPVNLIPTTHAWSPWQLVELSRFAGLKFVEVRTRLVTDVELWHSPYLGKED
jgi:hypothetical protein